MAWQPRAGLRHPNDFVRKGNDVQVWLQRRTPEQVAFLMWKAIEDAKNRGLDELDLGRSDINNEGLAVFKDRLGAARSVMHYWRFPKSDSAGETGWKTRFARQLVSVAPDSSLAAAGKLLYRHFG